MRAADLTLQWTWYLLGIPTERIGYDKGMLTWLREKRHRKAKKEMHICLLEVQPAGGKFGRFLTYWINERSIRCSASLNRGIEDADIIWVYSQDPLSSASIKKLTNVLGKARRGTPVMNHPNLYNYYHEPGSFGLLEKAGLNVPRSSFGQEDIGRTRVVYKMPGKHAAHKILSLYTGPREGFSPYEFIDSRGNDGLFTKYRCTYLNGTVLPNYLLFSDHWNVTWSSKTKVEFLFDLFPDLTDALQTVARVSGLDFFHVECLKRNTDNRLFIVDLNIYPNPISYTEVSYTAGRFGRWPAFDERWMLGIPEPSQKGFWEMFDKAMHTFTGKK